MEIEQNIYSDEELITFFLNGDNTSFDALFRKYHVMIRTFCIHYIGDREDAEECTQDVFRKVYFGLKKFRNDSSFKTWIYCIARNICYNKVNSLKSRLKRLTLSIDEPVLHNNETLAREFGCETTPRDNAVESEYMEKIIKTINSLSAKRREIFILHDIQNLSYEEISEITGDKTITLRSIISRARAQVLKKIRGNQS